MKNKAWADFWFDTYMKCIDRSLKYQRQASMALIRVALHINRDKNRRMEREFTVKAKEWRNLARFCAIEFEKYSEWKMPKVTRRSLKLE